MMLFSVQVCASDGARQTHTLVGSLLVTRVFVLDRMRTNQGA